jgi:hypothetical protein
MTHPCCMTLYAQILVPIDSVESDICEELRCVARLEMFGGPHHVLVRRHSFRRGGSKTTFSLSHPRHLCPTLLHPAQAPYVVPARSYPVHFLNYTPLFSPPALCCLFCGPRTPYRAFNNTDAHIRHLDAHKTHGKETIRKAFQTAQWGRRTGTSS